MSAQQTFDDLSPEERRLLYTFMPRGFDRDVMGGDEEALADLMETIRRWWREYEAYLEDGGRAELERQQKHLKRRQAKIEERIEELNSSERDLRRQLLYCPQAYEMEEGESIMASELAEKDDYAADVLRRRRRLSEDLKQAHEKKSTIHVQLMVIANLYRRREDFGDTKMPAFIEQFERTDETRSVPQPAGCVSTPGRPGNSGSMLGSCTAKIARGETCTTLW